MKYIYRILVLIQLLILPSALFAEDKSENPMSLYKDNYFILGQEDLKFRISAKYRLLSPLNIGLYYSYTGITFWDIYKVSAPFREYNHNPELFFQIKEGHNFFKNSSLGVMDFITVGLYEHLSNGKDGPTSRAWDRYFGEVQFSFGDKVNYGIRLKAWNFYNISDMNPDITTYIGYAEGEFFIKHPDSGTKFYFKGGPGSDCTKGWIEAGLMFPLFTAYIQPHLFMQLYHGYGEALVDYNKASTMLRAGIIFR